MRIQRSFDFPSSLEVWYRSIHPSTIEPSTNSALGGALACEEKMNSKKHKKLLGSHYPATRIQDREVPTPPRRVFLQKWNSSISKNRNQDPVRQPEKAEKSSGQYRLHHAQPVLELFWLLLAASRTVRTSITSHAQCRVLGSCTGTKCRKKSTIVAGKSCSLHLALRIPLTHPSLPPLRCGLSTSKLALSQTRITTNRSTATTAATTTTYYRTTRQMC